MNISMSISKIKNLWQYVTHPPKAQELAAKELENAKRSYLANKTHAEYYATLCTFETQRIKRLEQYLEEPSPTQPA
jgi:hypothetical protein